ncbi:hypothetical protein PISMIDRAFT_671773 [Pisolithus microcarpus 441]|uniref:Uncharacterized protein n=1 Tax=Pisolithus microcarpus 441 TaxID=765257 RepID=A0A0C9ZKD9_9AGAM|nr:hypothetical protein PISMIDRAFT_671773 [Pisolithus microcarpus 441]
MGRTRQGDTIAHDLFVALQDVIQPQMCAGCSSLLSEWHLPVAGLTSGLALPGVYDFINNVF